MPTEILAVEFGIVDGHILHLPESVLRCDFGIVDFYILHVLEHILTVAFQSVHINIVAEHERLGTAMQFEVLDTDAVATPEHFISIVHRHVFDVDFIHLTEHLWCVDNRVGHLQVVGIPQCRTPSNIEIAMVDFETVYMPEGIITLETAFERFDITTLRYYYTP